MATLKAALRALEATQIEVVAVSRFFASAAWPDPSDPLFVNAVARVRTDLGPGELMAALHSIEAQFGRERRARNAPRTIDIDIVDYEGRVESGAEGPSLPHPRAHERAFVLAPLLDVAPDWRHPVSGTPARDLLAAAEAAGGRATPQD